MKKGSEKKIPKNPKNFHRSCSQNQNISLAFFPQFSKSSPSQVTLMKLDFDASGNYFCEVSLDSPIFTKASNEEHLHVIGE
jgi:hypothetical protein